MSDLSPVTAAEFSAMPGIRHGWFTRRNGVSKGIYGGLNAGLGSGDDRTAVLENRQRMARHLGTDADHLATPFQIHSADARQTDRPWNGDRPKADAVVTATPGLAVGVVTADCGPILFADPVARVVGAAHAGWKGALNGVLENTVAEMERAGATRGNIVAILGPSISGANYEVGPEFPAPFLEREAEDARFFSPSSRSGHWMFDLPGYTVERLRKAGVTASSTGHCTYALEDDFFSYRRTTHRKEPDYGRQLSAIMLASH